MGGAGLERGLCRNPKNFEYRRKSTNNLRINVAFAPPFYIYSQKRCHPHRAPPRGKSDESHLPFDYFIHILVAATRCLRHILQPMPRCVSLRGRKRLRMKGAKYFEKCKECQIIFVTLRSNWRDPLEGMETGGGKAGCVRAKVWTAQCFRAEKSPSLRDLLYN